MAHSRPKKVSLDEVIHLVKQLPADQQEQLRLQLNRDAEGHHPFMDWEIDINSLACQQGVPESSSVASLKGDFWPEDENSDEFITTVRQWRKESRV